MQDLTDSKLQELMAQKEQLERQIAERRSEAIKDVIEKIQQAITFYGITASDIFGTERRIGVGSAKPKIKPKYQDPDTGATWTGRGKAPKWIADKDRDQFLIE